MWFVWVLMSLLILGLLGAWMLTVVFSIRPGWITTPVLWVCSSMASLSVQQTDGAAPWLTLKVRAPWIYSAWKTYTFLSFTWTKEDDETDHMHAFSLLWASGGNVCNTVCAVEDDVSQCASSAVNGYKAWSGLTCYQRAKVLLRYVKLTFTHFRNLSIDCLNHRVEINVRVACPPPTGWWAFSASTVSVCRSCVSCVGPPARPPPSSDCCNTTAAGLSSETLSSPTGHH